MTVKDFREKISCYFVYEMQLLKVCAVSEQSANFRTRKFPTEPLLIATVFLHPKELLPKPYKRQTAAPLFFRVGIRSAIRSSGDR